MPEEEAKRAVHKAIADSEDMARKGDEVADAGVVSMPTVGAYLLLAGALAYLSGEKLAKQYPNSKYELNNKAQEIDHDSQVAEDVRKFRGGDDEPSEPEDPNKEIKEQIKRWTAEEVVNKISQRINDHEDGDHKGHTIKKHIGKSLDWLMKRLENEPHIKIASSYPDQETAERTINEVVKARANEIADWANRASSGEIAPFRADFSKDIGYGK